MKHKKVRLTLADIRPAHRKIHRWQIIDKKRAKDYGITGINPGRAGIICLNIADIPDGLSIEETLYTAELNGVLICHTRKIKRHETNHN